MDPSPVAPLPRAPIKAYSYVRFSTPEQLKGASLARQKEKSEAFAREHGLELVESYRDLGLSAFKGKNRTVGALAGFLAAVKDKRIKAGSYLIVEDLDRLSREAVEEALPRFLDLINAGIVIVTLNDNQTYRKGELSLPQLVISLTKMSLAHEESVKKSGRVADSWKRRRANIAEKPITGYCPGWLRLGPKGKFIEIPERAELIRKIFAETVNGKGRYQIVNELNAARVPSWCTRKRKANSHGWHTSFIQKLLGNRALLGEFQPHTIVDGKRTETGDVVPNYFPRILEDNTFYLAQASAARRRSGKGRVTVSDADLFAGLCVCGRCGGPVGYSDKGEYQYLRCVNRSRRASDCDPCSRSYQSAEDAFLKWCVDYDFSGGQRSIKQQKEAELAATQEAMESAQRTLDRFNEAMAQSTRPVSSFLPRIEAAEGQLELYKNTAAILRAEIETAQDSITDVNFAALAKVPENRLRLRAAIRQRVARIVVDFGGWRGPADDPHNPEASLAVELKDGSRVVIYGEEHVHWVKDGRVLEYEGGREPENEADNEPGPGYKPRRLQRRK